MHPRAAGKEILLVSRLASLTFGLLSGVFCIVLLQIGININWLFFVIGWVAHRCRAPVCTPLSVCMLEHDHHSSGRSVRGSVSHRSTWKGLVVKRSSHQAGFADCRLLVASVFPPISFLLTWNKVGKVRQHASE